MCLAREAQAFSFGGWRLYFQIYEGVKCIAPNFEDNGAGMMMLLFLWAAHFKRAELFQEAIASAELVIAGDKGAATALKFGRVLFLWLLGDSDSLDYLLSQKIQEQGSQTIGFLLRKMRLIPNWQL